MKSLIVVLLLCLVTGWLPLSVHADDPVPTPLEAAITQLNNDLLAIPVGDTVTDAQHQVLVADLTALTVGIVPAPAAADLDAVATMLGKAAAAGNVTSDTLEEIDADLVIDATDADNWLDDISGDASDLRGPVDPSTTPDEPGIGDPMWPVEDLVPVFVTAVDVRSRRTKQHHDFDLNVQSGQSPANQFYNGRVSLDTRQVDGAAPASTVGVTAVSLPTNNPYTVTVTRKSDGTALTLGEFNVKPVTSLVFNKYLTAAIPDDYDQHVENLTLGQVIFGGSHLKKALPADFDARDVASVTLTDALGVARLSGHPSIGVGNYRTRGVVLHLSGEADVAPGAYALARGKSIGGYGNTFYFSARHLPASAAVTLVADGVAIGQFTTGAHGRLLITEGSYPVPFNRAGTRQYSQTLPKTLNLSRVKVLTLTDAQGNVLLSNSPL